MIHTILGGTRCSKTRYRLVPTTTKKKKYKTIPLMRTRTRTLAHQHHIFNNLRYVHHVCIMCVCACVRERERERKASTQNVVITNVPFYIKHMAQSAPSTGGGKLKGVFSSLTQFFFSSSVTKGSLSSPPSLFRINESNRALQ